MQRASNDRNLKNQSIQKSEVKISVSTSLCWFNEFAYRRRRVAVLLVLLRDNA
jgi:hypothetical protein